MSLNFVRIFAGADGRAGVAHRNWNAGTQAILPWDRRGIRDQCPLSSPIRSVPTITPARAFRQNRGHIPPASPVDRLGGRGQRACDRSSIHPEVGDEAQPLVAGAARKDVARAKTRYQVRNTHSIRLE